jgi:hypothetical protein
LFIFVDISNIMFYQFQDVPLRPAASQQPTSIPSMIQKYTPKYTPKYAPKDIPRGG